MKKLFVLFIFLLTYPLIGFSQHYMLPKGKKFEKVRFQLVNNLIVIPLEVNGTELSFILDSGVSTPILFNTTGEDSLQLKNVSEITINGLGDGEPISALSSKGNFFRLGKTINVSQKLYVIMNEEINFSPSLGIPIHGIIGYDLFKDFIVDISYSNKSIKFFKPSAYRYTYHKKEQILDLSIIERKAYLDAQIALEGNKNIDVKMLLDTGSSDAIWLFEDDKIPLPKQHYDDFLGKGLSGNVYGKRTKINQINIGKFALKDAKAAYPDMLTFSNILSLGDRNGSLGGELLKRFDVVFDYPHQKITLKKNKYFNDIFHYNISGIDLQHAGMRYISDRINDKGGAAYVDGKVYGDIRVMLYGAEKLSLVPEIVVSGIRTGSPAHEAGLREGDVILAVNGKRIHRYKLQEILLMINRNKGKRVRVLVERYNKDLLFSLLLKDIFK